jgi:DNA polymerase III subunit epsilon
VPWRRRQQLAAPPLDLPWQTREYCVLDFETTGLDLRHDDIISFGAVTIRAGRIDLSSTEYGLVVPRRRSSAASFAVHALGEHDLADGMPIRECAARLAGCLGNRVLVAHAAWIETALISRALATCGQRFHGSVIDTAALARAARLAEAGTGREPSIEYLAGRLGLPVHTPHHALGDALSTAQLFLVLAARLGDETLTARELLALSRANTRR